VARPHGPDGVTRAAVAALLLEGCKLSEIATILGLSKPTVSYHARRLGYPPSEKFARRYDWAEVQGYYDGGNSIRACCEHFGLSRGAWHDAAKRGVMRSRPPAAPVETYLVNGRRTNRHHLKGRLLAAGLKEHRCEICGISEWRGRPLSMALHHVNGDGLDNRLENLQLLCPNCHSQTDNFGAKKIRRESINHADRRPSALDGEGAVY